MLLPGISAFGFVIHLSSVGSSQVMPEPLSDSEYAKFGAVQPCALHAVKRRAEPVVAFVKGVALATMTVEC